MTPQVTGFLPTMWEAVTGFSAPGFSHNIDKNHYKCIYVYINFPGDSIVVTDNSILKFFKIIVTVFLITISLQQDIFIFALKPKSPTVIGNIYRFHTQKKCLNQAGALQV